VRRIRAQGGAAATLVVLFLPCLLACAALVLDLGSLLVVRAQLRVAADMGALAGVQDLDFELLGQGRIVIRAEDARSDAVSWVRANLSGRSFIDMDGTEVVVTVLNTDGGRAATCPVTGRALTHPTVCVYIRAPARLPFLPGLGPVPVSVHADASVVGRP